MTMWKLQEPFENVLDKNFFQSLDSFEKASIFCVSELWEDNFISRLRLDSKVKLSV